MNVCVCRFDLLLLDYPDSLKGKRHVIKSLKERIRSRFGVSVSEVGSLDLLHRGELGVAVVGDSRDRLESVTEQIRRMIESHGSVEIIGELVDHLQY